MKKKRPALRFSGFDNDWEQRKLNELVTYHSSNLTASDARDVGKFDLYDANSVIGKTNIEPMNSEYITIIKDGAGVGRIRTMPQNTMFIGTMGGLQVNKSDINFIFSLLTRFDLGKEYSGSTIPHIYFKDYGNNDYYVPAKDEQQAIGQYFTNLDHLITLHQCKCKKLICIKKSMLENMFPQKDEKIPRIRFSGFTDAWEQRKLGDIYTERNERGNEGLGILSVSIHHGVSNGELDMGTLGKQVRRSEDKSLYKHVYSGDLVFNMMRAWQGAIGVVKSEGMVSPAYVSAVPDDSIFPLFMDYCLRRESIINQINNLSYGVTDFRKRLYWEPFTRVSIKIPSVDEQRKIAEILCQLDHLITLHQRELEKLQNIKKAMLEKMFV